MGAKPVSSYEELIQQSINATPNEKEKKYQNSKKYEENPSKS